MSGAIKRHSEPPCQCGQVSFDHGRSYHDRHREIIQAEQARRRGREHARKAGELDPEWVMVGVDVPAGKRLYASKDLKGSAFQVAMDAYANGEGWNLTTVMQKMLVVTRPTYAECLAELMRIWRNWENEGRELPAGSRERRAL